MLTWYAITRSDYDGASAAAKTDDCLFFLTDTKEIYRGQTLFTEACVAYGGDRDTAITAPAVGRVYINTDDMSGAIWNGTDWTEVINPVSTTVTSGDTKAVSGGAVKTYVDEAVADASAAASNSFNGANYSAASNTLTFVRNDGTNPVAVEITDLPCDVLFTKDTANNVGQLQLADKSGNPIGEGISLELERFVERGVYDATTESIILYYADDESITIPVGALIDMYNGAETTTATVSTDKVNNTISANVKISTAAGQALTVDSEGLFVNLAEYIKASAVETIKSDLEDSIATKVDKMGAGDANKVVVSTADGSVSRSTANIGTSTLGNSTTTLAVEAAVKTYTDNAASAAQSAAISAAATDAQNKADAAQSAAIAAAATDAQTKADAAQSAAIAAAATDAQTKANAAQANAIAASVSKSAISTTLPATAAAASNEEVPSEKAVVAALEWKTTI